MLTRSRATKQFRLQFSHQTNVCACSCYIYIYGVLYRTCLSLWHRTSAAYKFKTRAFAWGWTLATNQNAAALYHCFRRTKKSRKNKQFSRFWTKKSFYWIRIDERLRCVFAQILYAPTMANIELKRSSFTGRIVKIGKNTNIIYFLYTVGSFGESK